MLQVVLGHNDHINFVLPFQDAIVSCTLYLTYTIRYPHAWSSQAIATCVYR